jgi:hypothetical protein
MPVADKGATGPQPTLMSTVLQELGEVKEAVPWTSIAVIWPLENVGTTDVTANVQAIGRNVR